ncbi:DUF1850 domain-containing protein [Halorussus caseinilyticus]|uniref:DUF1850 domain-containing protein n=1 Tax=Halorussus caseinilyticus TaxID=3034025 RepID=A0ABD5WRQ3_9EURY
MVALVVGVGGSISVAPLGADDQMELSLGYNEDTLRQENNYSDRKLFVAEDAETGERLLSVPVSEGTTVALNYTHSVEKTPVLDVYEVNGTELEMVRMEFSSYGAGLPAQAEVNVTDNGTFVFDPEGSYDRIFVSPGPVADHRLVVGDRAYDLVDLSDGRSVKLFVTVANSTPTEDPATIDTEPTTDP